jgi:transposase
MGQFIIVGCDLHARNMLVKYAVDREKPLKRSLRNTRRGRQTLVRMLRRLSEEAGGAQVVFAYEASSLGFTLHDQLTAAGFTCHVLAPTKIPRSWKHRLSKTDERDAQLIFEMLRAHLLAGNELPTVWVPDRQTRDDREVTRARIDVGQKLTRVKCQIQSLLKRNGVSRPTLVPKPWSKRFLAWLDALVGGPELGPYASVWLSSLLGQLRALETEKAYLDEHVAALARRERYAAQVEAMTQWRGVGEFVAVAFAAELGDPERFSNRREVASFFGLVPQSDESGEGSDRKGHITRQGSGRVRRLLCQAAHAWIRWNPLVRSRYERLVARNPKKKKIAVVAMMRRLCIRLWHAACDARRAAAACREGEE